MSYRGLIMAMEEAENTSEDSSEVEVAQTSEELAKQVAEIAEDIQDIKEDLQDVASGNQASEELGEIADVADKKVEDGEGLSEDAAEVATVAIESICNRLGISSSHMIPATESFSNSRTRVSSSRMVVEAASDTLKRVWVALKAMLKRIWTKIVNFLAKITGSTKLLRKRIKSLQAAVNGIPSDVSQKNKTISGKSYTKLLWTHKDKKVQTAAKEIYDNINLFLELGPNVVSAFKGAVEYVQKHELRVKAANDEAVVAALSVPAEDKAATFQKAYDTKLSADSQAQFEKIFAPLFAKASNLAIPVDSGTAGKNDEKRYTFFIGPFGNAKVLSTTLRGSNNSKNTAFPKTQGGFECDAIDISMISYPNASFKTEIDALDKGQMNELIIFADDIAAKLDKLAEYKKDAQKLIDSLEAACNAAISLADKFNDNKDDAQKRSNGRRALNGASQFISGAISSINSISTGLASCAYGFCYGIAGYVTDCISNYRKVD